MPSLLIFRRRWNISSDDFVFPSITEALVRFIWVLAAIGLFFFHNPTQCKSLEWLVYLGLLVAGNIVTILLCIAIAYESSKGSILEVSARKNVPKLIYCRVPLFLAEIIYTIVTAVIAFGILEIDACFSLISLQITVGLELFLICCVFLGIIVVFNTHGSQSLEQSFLLETRYWQTRMILCKIRQNDEMRTALDEIAALLASFFSETDYVGSDILAGLLLLVHSPEQVPAIEMQLNDDQNFPEWMKLPNSLNMVCRMLDFAVAVYGWPSYIVNNCSCVSWCLLLRRTNCCLNCCGQNETTPNADDCCSWNTESFLIESNLDKADVYYMSFRNKLYQTPFVVLTDHVTQSIVITIRGSASILDFVTDLTLSEDYFSMDVDNDPILCEDKELDSEGAVRVHKGMLKSAHHVYNTLKKNNVLEDLHSLHPSYQLIVCGHSLGAGVASLLTLLLKQTYPTIRCYAFSPPGCVVSEHGIEEMEQHVLSVIVGDDIIPRISYQSLMRLKVAIDHEINNSNRAKYEILIKGIFKLFFSAPWDLHSDSASSDNRSCRRLINNEEYSSREGDNVSIQITPSEVAQRVRLYPPGKLLHFAFDPVTHEAQPNWIKHDYLKDIQLTGSILADHMPFRVRKLLRKARNEHVYL